MYSKQEVKRQFEFMYCPDFTFHGDRSFLHGFTNERSIQIYQVKQYNLLFSPYIIITMKYDFLIYKMAFNP